MKDHAVVDIFCGVGGLTHGFVLEDFSVVAGFDADENCRFPFEHNNQPARFVCKRLENITASEIQQLYQKDTIRILVGCAPCQPFSKYTKKRLDRTGKWQLVERFADLICEVDPEIVSMENVPSLVSYRDGVIYSSFIKKLTEHGYHVTPYPAVYCPDYGVPQRRTRLVLFASKFGKIELAPATHTPKQYGTVRATIEHLPKIAAGEKCATDPLHKAAGLSELNLRRIQASRPGGTWRDWDKALIPECFLKESGTGYVSVYGRMEWDDLAPTITTECFGYGSGRFGHPEQDRAISLREAALLQTFPVDYSFVEAGSSYHFKQVGRHIGNAVPVELARIIARSIQRHLATISE
jgi:DNA (cytosine-5)-methyltransferase 1